MLANSEPDASKFLNRKKRLRNVAVAGGAIGLIALGAMLMKGLLDFGLGAGGSSINADAKTPAENEESKRPSSGSVVTLRVVGEAYEVREMTDATATWHAVDLAQIKSMVEAAPGNESGIRVRYYVSETAVFETVERLRQALLQIAEAREIYAVDDDAE